MPDIVIVGSGVAGLTAALAARASGARVRLVTKSALTESNSFYAQGGIAAAVWEDDTVASHIADTLRAGAGLALPEAVRVLCSEGPDRVRALIELGVAFDRADGRLARGLEAAHSRPRILHAGGDATGAAIESTLTRAVLDSDVEIDENRFLSEIIVTDGAARGILTIDSAGRQDALAADAVVLASGGAGQLYRHTTNPLVATGDGTAAAWRAGAQLADLEFYQFHPTALAVPGESTGSFLLSEAVRGEGAILVNDQGRRFMFDVHPDGELAPRDVVARGIAIEMAAQDGTPVRLDATALGGDFLERRFPTIHAACLASGHDWRIEPVPVTPAAHYWMGGIATDIHGRTSVAGLYAAGETACTGAHGANRLASNSLLEAVVFGHRAAADATARDASVWDVQPFADDRADERPGDEDAGPERSAGQDESAGDLVDRRRLQTLMWESVGVHRSEGALDDASAALASWRAERSEQASVREREDANLLDLARLVAATARARHESRGAHFRSDYPAPSRDGAHHSARTGMRSGTRKAVVPC